MNVPVGKDHPLEVEGWQPAHVEGEGRAGPFVVTCDHATNTVPEFVAGGDLGISAEEMARHIAWDVGALGVARELARRLDAPLVHSDFSRLVIDPNRGEDDPTLIMKLYDGTIIPANRHVDAAERERRLAKCYRPYHQRLADLLAEREAAGRGPVIIAVHSFTPRLNGHAMRPWQVGILHHDPNPFAEALIASLRTESDLCVGDNEPYPGYLVGDSMYRHAMLPGRPYALIELRNDLIRDAAGQGAWAARLAPHILDAARQAGLVERAEDRREQAVGGAAMEPKEKIA